MADIAGKRSLKHISDRIPPLELNCSSCEYEGATRQADYFCTDCREYLCDSCEKMHRKLKVTRNHTVVAGYVLPSKEDSKRTTTPSRVLCSCETEEVSVLSEEVKVYCKDHNDLLCRYCKSSKHDKCKTSDILEASLKFEATSTDDMLQNVNGVTNKVMKLQELRTKDFENLTAQITTYREEVKAFKKQLYVQLDLMEESTLAELDQYDKRYRKNIEQQVELCNLSLQKMKSETTLFQEAKHTGDKGLMFIRNIQLLKTIENADKLVSDADTTESVPIISFDCDKRLIQTGILGLGSVKSNNTETRTRTGYADMSVRSRQINVKLSSDAGDPKVTGSVFMPNGELVICDKYNENIKVLNADFTTKDQLDVRGEPWDVAITSCTEVVTTLPYSKVLQFVQVRPALQLGRTLHVDKVCRGIAVSDGHIYVSFVDGEIRVMNRNGLKLKSFGQNPDGSFRIKRPYHIAVSRDGKLYFSDDDALICMTVHERILYSYRNPELKNALGMDADSRGTVFICGDYGNIYIVDKHGVQLKVLYDIDGLSRPNTISFRPNDNIFVVGCEDQNKLIVFQIE